MKIKKLISLFLAFAILMSIGSTAFAVENQTTAPEVEVVAELDETAVEDAVRELYESLTPEAKEVFAHAISGDADLVAYFQKTVDESFVPVQNVMPFAVTADPLTQLVEELMMMGLPEPVVSALTAMGSGIVAAAADGPLLFGDACLLIATTSAAIVMAANWETVGPLFSDIVRAFQRAFVSSAEVIAAAFEELKTLTMEQPSYTEDKVVVSTKEKVITHKRVTYRCTTKVTDLTEEQKRAGRYYVALRIGTMLYVDLNRPISGRDATTLLRCNSSFAGIVTGTETMALAIAAPVRTGNDIHHEGHPGYLPHAHPSWAGNAHCWYFYKE